MAVAPPEKLFDPSRKQMMVFAHQDDEIMYTGLIGRLGPELSFLWVTNGDGIAPAVNADPEEYSQIRLKETDAVLKTIGRPLKMRHCLAYSEIEIYDKMIAITENPGERDKCFAYFAEIAEKVYLRIKKFDPDIVWTGQYQNGHPEHDLTHLFTAYALRRIYSETGKKIEFYHLPEYEYTILIPMRFHPLYRGVVCEIFLTDEEVALKRTAIEKYPSQKDLIDKFERVINGLGKIAGLVGRPFTAEDFMRRETFGPADFNADFTKSFHLFEMANYMMDRHNGVKVRFDKHVAEIARAIAP